VAPPLAEERPTGEVFDDCAGAVWCPQLVVLPPGEFTMGSPASEDGRSEREGTERVVRIARFAAGRFPVTRGHWAVFVAATVRETRRGCTWTGRVGGGEPDPNGSWRDVGFEQSDNHPVVCVTWHDAQDYVRWLSNRTGHTYRLLSEAEWEYAARAGSTGPYPWGPSASHEYANYGADVCCSGLATGRDTWVNTSPVDAFPPNAFGLYDMHGNTLEWVQDCLAPSYAGLPTDGSAYQVDGPLRTTGRLASLNGLRACDYRILRGGDWGNPPGMIRSAYRNWGPPAGATLETYGSGGVGFRIGRDLPRVEE
jgi:formylglycine-generating enzyme required for sulfatase activity